VSEASGQGTYHASAASVGVDANSHELNRKRMQGQAVLDAKQWAHSKEREISH
jgi:hypothetical protein